MSKIDKNLHRQCIEDIYFNQVPNGLTINPINYELLNKQVVELYFARLKERKPVYDSQLETINEL